MYVLSSYYLNYGKTDPLLLSAGLTPDLYTSVGNCDSPPLHSEILKFRVKRVACFDFGTDTNRVSNRRYAVSEG